MTNLLFPLVGSHFRPPASLVLACLEGGTPLRLEREPSNPYDSAAVQVWVKPSSIPENQHPKLEEELPGAGFELAELLAIPELMLGFLCSASNQRQLSKAPAGEVWSANVELPESTKEGKLLFSSTGQALVSVAVTQASERSPREIGTDFHSAYEKYFKAKKESGEEPLPITEWWEESNGRSE